MSTAGTAMHYVSTLEEARKLIQGREQWWVSNCGCRESRGSCSRSRIDVCVLFVPSFPDSGSGTHAIGRDEIDAILKEAAGSGLVPRPFRDEARTAIAGVCFCCDDCCWYFKNRSEPCDKGALIERTEMELCSQCNACVDACRFGARKSVDGILVVDRDECFGCGVCATACPVETCITMVARD